METLEKRIVVRYWELSRLVVTALFLIFAFTTGLAAQSRQTDGPTDDLTRAESYLNQRKYEEAIILLEKMQRRTPDNPNVIALLRRTYQRTKEYSKLLDLLLRRLAQSETYLQDAGTIADCQFRLGMTAAAESTLTALLVLPPDNPQIHREVARIYRRNGRHTQAVDTYLEARILFDQPRLFSRELADIYESRRDYAEAIQEYFVDLQENPRNLEIVRRKINEITRTEEGTSELRAALEEIASSHPDNFLARLLYGELLLESENPEAAWTEYLAADNLSQDSTKYILYYIRRCLENGYHEPARRACLLFFERNPRHSSMIDVRQAYAMALVGLAKPDSAITVLKEVAELFRMPDSRAEVQFQIGNVYFEYLNNLDSAEFYYLQASSISRRTDIAFNATLRLGDCRLRRGDIDGADSAYAVSDGLRLNVEQREKVAFKRAELLFFTAQFDSVTSILKAMVAKYPRGFYVNDAIILNLQITENREPLDWSLRRFAAGSLQKRQLHLDSARTLFWELAIDSANTLADDALLELGRLYASVGQPDSAVIAYGMLVEQHPDGFLVPAALTEQGGVYAEQLNQPDSARAALRRVLTDFADSPFLEEARRRLQKLGPAQPGS